MSLAICSVHWVKMVQGGKGPLCLHCLCDFVFDPMHCACAADIRRYHPLVDGVRVAKTADQAIRQYLRERSLLHEYEPEAKSGAH